MTSTSPARAVLTLAVASTLAVAVLAGGAVAQPNSDVYVYPDTQPQFALATETVTVATAPSPGIVTAYRDTGTATTGLSFEKPIVVAAPHVGRGHNDAAGTSVTLTGFAAGN